MTPIDAIELLHKLLLMADFTDEYGDMCDSEPYEEAVAMASNALTELRLIDKSELCLENDELELIRRAVVILLGKIKSNGDFAYFSSMEMIEVSEIYNQLIKNKNWTYQDNCIATSKNTKDEVEK